MFGLIVRTYRDAFSGLPRRIWLLAVITLIHRSGTMVIPFLALYLTTQLGMSVRLAGIYLAVHGIGGVLGAVVGGRLAERIGNVRTMQLTLGAAGVGFVALGTVRDPWAIGAVLLFTSLAAEGFRTPSSADIGLTASPEIRARAFALRRLAINLGMALGPAVGGVLATVSYGWLFAIDGLTCLLAGIAVTFLLARQRAGPIDEAGSHAAPDGPTPALWRNGELVAVLASAGLMTLAFGQLFATYPITLKGDFGHSEAVIGLLMALNTLIIVLFEMVLLHRLSGSRPPRVVATGCLALAVGFILVQADPRIAVAVAAMSIVTLGEMLTHPVIESFVFSLVPKAAISRAVGALNATFAATFVLAPLVGTAVYDAWGYRALWMSCAGVAALAGLSFALVDRGGRAAKALQPGS